MMRSLPPVVSTEWLAARLTAPGGPPASGEPVILDIRFAEEYEAGHIPGAVTAPFAIVSEWSDCTDDLLLELPPAVELFKALGDHGLTTDSTVVVVGRVEEPPAPPYPLADAVRVAVTLMWAGIEDVAVLAGGHAKWEAEGRPVTTCVPDITHTSYSAGVKDGMFVSTEYVKDRIGRVVLLDARDPDQYFGASIDPFADMRGHIPTARSLPLVWVWEKDGTYRPPEFIAQMVEGVLGGDREQEIVCYCGVGGYASTWWFLLTQLLGYTNVKIYDGSMEAWVKDNSLVRCTWTS